MAQATRGRLGKFERLKGVLLILVPIESFSGIDSSVVYVGFGWRLGDIKFSLFLIYHSLSTVNQRILKRPRCFYFDFDGGPYDKLV